MRFMDVHHGMKDITQEQLAIEHQKDLDNEKDTGVHFLQAWADPKTGNVFCLSEGPNAEAVQDVHRKSGKPADEIYEVPIEVH